MPRTKKPAIADIRRKANQIRENVINMLLEAESGHTAGSLGTADIFAALFFNVLNINPKKPKDPTRDRFVLSNGHICPVLYATLHARGFISKKDLWTLRKIDSKLEGHPVKDKVPGVEVTSGSLGQGISQGIGMALAAKMDNKQHRIYIMTSDGELNEGQTWEASMFAPNKDLTNITWIIDRNNIQIDGRTEEVMPLENLRAKLESFNWFVIEIDGHNIEEIIKACKMAEAVRQRPAAIIAHTIPGKGVDFMEYKVEWHGKSPNKDQAAKALQSIRSLNGKINSIYD